MAHGGNPFVASLAGNFEQALGLLDAALADCPDELWATDLWPDEAPTAPSAFGGLHGSAPWFLAYHALTTLDFDLTGEYEPWLPPPPFDTEHTYGMPNRVFTKSELRDYLEHRRERVRQTLDALTEAVAARALPATHRHHPKAYGALVGSIPLHVVEHAAQLRQHLTAAGVRVRPMPGDQTYRSG